jgi:hypothetical protein
MCEQRRYEQKAEKARPPQATEIKAQAVSTMSQQKYIDCDGIPITEYNSILDVDCVIKSMMAEERHRRTEAW